MIYFGVTTLHCYVCHLPVKKLISFACIKSSDIPERTHMSTTSKCLLVSPDGSDMCGRTVDEVSGDGSGRAQAPVAFCSGGDILIVDFL